MNIWDYLDNGNFAGLAIFSLEDLLNATNEYEHFTLPADYKEFLDKRDSFRKEYEKGLAIEVKKAQEEYNKAIQSNQIPDEDPDIVEKKIRSKYRNNIISLIRSYFNHNEFAIGKNWIKDYNPNQPEQSLSSNDLAVALVPIRRQLYTFLSVIGWYQFHKHYFLSANDWKEMNYLYSKEATFVNKSLGYEYNPNLSLFLKDNRLNQGKSKQYIDIDGISLESLIIKYFKTNINELVEIAHIIRDKFNKASGDTWEEIKKATNDLIKKAESNHIMIKV